MNPDDLQQAWSSQVLHTQLTINADLLLKDVQHKQREFTVALFWRDVREVGVSLLLIPAWVALGIGLALPWGWYLMLPVLVGILGFLLCDLLRHRRRPPEPGIPLRQSVESSLAQVDRQVWLLRNVHWWCLLPMELAALPFFVQVGWNDPLGGWGAAIVLVCAVSVFSSILMYVYWLNQHAVRNELLPRRQELAALLASLGDEEPVKSPLFAKPMPGRESESGDSDSDAVPSGS